MSNTSFTARLLPALVAGLMGIGTAHAVQKDVTVAPGDHKCVSIDASAEVHGLGNILGPQGERVTFRLRNEGGLIASSLTNTFFQTNLYSSINPGFFPSHFRLCAHNNASTLPVSVQLILNGF